MVQETQLRHIADRRKKEELLSVEGSCESAATDVIGQRGSEATAHAATKPMMTAEFPHHPRAIGNLLQDELSLGPGDGAIGNGLLHGRFHGRLHPLLQLGRSNIGQDVI